MTTSRTVPSILRLTPGGYAGMARRLQDIREHRLPRMRPLLVDRERDERDVAEFERLLQEVDDLEALLAEAQIIVGDPTGFEGRVEVGMRVHVTLADGSKAWVRPVHPAEAFLDDERISMTSPLGIALLGSRVSHVVWIDAPAGVWGCTVLAVEPNPRD
jgi:transcription elongation GreA/GreB family factor